MADIDTLVNKVSSKGSEWAALDPHIKVDLIQKCIDRLLDNEMAWVSESCVMKGYTADPKLESNRRARTVEYESIVALVNHLRGARDVYSCYNTKKKAWVAPKLHTEKRSNTVSRVKVYPISLFDKVTSSGMKLYVYTKSSTPNRVNFPTNKPNSGTLRAILGAGNTDSCFDLVDALFIQNRVVIYKPNPVNEPVSKYTEYVFQPIIDLGYLAYIRGGAEIGQALIQHPQVFDFAMTGSSRTFDRILFGADADKQTREYKRNPQNQIIHKPVVAELGGVTPWIIVPGNWSPKHLSRMASHLAYSKLDNNSFYCCSPQVVVTSSSWKQRDEFLNLMKSFMKQAEPIHWYYPGSLDRAWPSQRKALLEEGFKSVDIDIAISKKETDQANAYRGPLFATNLSQDSFVLKNEAFCAVLGEVCLESASVEEFLTKTLEFTKTKLYGSLSATVMIHPKERRVNRNVFERFIDELEYGSIAINTWSIIQSAFPHSLWGAYPKHSLDDIGSGMGMMGNMFGLGLAVKGVVDAPFRNDYTFPLAVTKKDKMRAEAGLRSIVHFFAKPGLKTLIQLVLAFKLGFPVGIVM